ncbi:hypothetical protein DMUE_4171 [Dictyocoela muelleri]|nr:hypothetical protein DMUE_4171 [Dictyocoela muelleri]
MSKWRINKHNPYYKNTIKCAADKAIEYLGVFYVLPRIKNSIILGMSFLKQNLAVIDLKNNLITVYGREYELEGSQNNDAIFENQITTNTKILNISECKERINKLIKTAKLKIQRLEKLMLYTTKSN